MSRINRPTGIRGSTDLSNGEEHPGAKPRELPQFDRPDPKDLDPNVDYNPKRKDFWNASFWYQNRVVKSLTGRSVLGKVLFSLLDVLPGPNLHEILRSVLKGYQGRQIPPQVGEIAKEVIKRVDITRTVLSLAFGLMIVYVIVRLFG